MPDMISIRHSAYAIFLFFLPLTGVAQQSMPSNKTEAINQIFKEIPFEGKVKELPRELHAQFSQNPFGLQPAKNKQMMNLFSQAFVTDSLLNDMRRAFERNYKPAYADSALLWLNMENTQSVLEARNQFYTLQGIRKRVVNQYELEQNPPAESRKQLIKSLADNLSAARAEVESGAIIFRALVTAFSKLSDQQFGPVQIEGFVDNYRNQMLQQADQETAQRLMLMYHDLPNDTLQKYNAFYKTESGTWFSQATSESIHSAYRAAADRFLKSIQNI